jgi:hypothetical protein
VPSPRICDRWPTVTQAQSWIRLRLKLRMQILLSDVSVSSAEIHPSLTALYQYCLSCNVAEVAFAGHKDLHLAQMTLPC